MTVHLRTGNYQTPSPTQDGGWIWTVACKALVLVTPSHTAVGKSTDDAHVQTDDIEKVTCLKCLVIHARSKQ